MAEPEWTVLAEAGRVRILQQGQPGEPPHVVEEWTDPHATPALGPAAGDEALRRFARQVTDRLEQAYVEARFEFLRVGAEPRLLGLLRAEIDRHLDLHRAVLEWRALNVVPLDAAGR